MLVTTNINDKIKIQISNWQTGMYYVKVRNDEGYVNVQKFIVK